MHDRGQPSSRTGSSRQSGSLRWLAGRAVQA